MNRHDVFIWDPERYGTPKSFEQAMDMAELLEERENEEPTAKLIAFGQQLESINKEDGNRFDGMTSRMKSSKRAVLKILMPDYGWQQELKILVDAANMHGLVLFDPEIVMVFVPPNKIFPSIAAKLWENTNKMLDANKDFPTTVKQFEKWFEPILALMLNKYAFIKNGFNPDNTIYPVYQREVDIGTQYIMAVYDIKRTGFDIYIVPLMTSDDINKIYSSFKFFKQKSIFSGCFLSNVLRMPSEIKAINNKDDALKILHIIESKLIPILDSSRNIKGLDNVLNSESYPYFKEYQQNAVSMPYCLIVARLANNPDFEQLVLELPKAKWLGANTKAMSEEWPRLVKYLRDEFDPKTFAEEQARLKAEDALMKQQEAEVLARHFTPKTNEELLDLGQWRDPKTKLIWMRCCIGQQWEDGKGIGYGKLMNWQSAIAAAKELEKLGWRLPTDKELKTLMLPNQAGYVTEEGILLCPKEQGQYGTFWTSTTESKTKDIILAVVFYSGSVDKYDCNQGCYVRLVRSS